jgi:LacI family transcriptional regulator
MIRSADVAKQAGVSRATVSVVLNGRTDVGISEATRLRVLETARALGYRPHRSGRAIRSGKTGNLAFLLSTFNERSLFSPRLLDGLIDGAAEHDQHLLVSRLSDEKLTDVQFVPKILREFAADGLILNYNSAAPERLFELITEARIPTIWINDRRDADCVFPDDFSAIYQATERLIADGHTQIGYAGWHPGPHFSMHDRLEGYRAAMNAHGLLESTALLETESIVTLSEATAVVCYSPDVVRILREQLPENNIQLVTPHFERLENLTTLLLPDYPLGIAAVAQLMQKIEQPERELPPVTVAYV